MTLILKGSPERAAAATEQIATMSGVPGVVFGGSLGEAATTAALFPDRKVEWLLDTYAPDITGQYKTQPRDMDVMVPFGGLSSDDLSKLLYSGPHPVDTILQAALVPSFFGHTCGSALRSPIRGFPRKAGRIVMRDAGEGLMIPTLAAEAQAVVASLGLGPTSDEKYHASAQRFGRMVAELHGRPDVPRSEFLGPLTRRRLRKLTWVN